MGYTFNVLEELVKEANTEKPKGKLTKKEIKDIKKFAKSIKPLMDLFVKYDRGEIEVK